MANFSWIKRIMGILFAILMCWCVVNLTTYGWQPLFVDRNLSAASDPQIIANLRSTVKVLSEDIGVRNYTVPANLNKAADFISDHFRSLGYTVEAQKYTVGNSEFKNIIAYVGQTMPDESIIIGAHYDTCFNPGADDNASGVAGLLELARQFKGAILKTPLVFVAFVNEEPPFFTTEEMGSLVFTKYLKKNHKSVKAAVILEMLGVYNEKPFSQKYLPLMGPFYPNQANFIAVVGNFPSSTLVHHLVQGMRQGSDFPVRSIVAPSFIPGIYFSDHWSFWKEGYPAVMVTDTAFLRYKHYHKHSDTIEKLNFSKMSYVIQQLNQGIVKIANEDSKKGG